MEKQIELSTEKLREIIQLAVVYGRLYPFTHDYYYEGQESNHYVTASEYADTVIKLLTLNKNRL